MQTGIEKKKHSSHLITTSSVQSVANKNDDKSPKAATEGKPNFPVPRPTFGNLKPTKMENNNTDGTQNAAIGTKNAPRLPPKPSK